MTKRNSFHSSFELHLPDFAKQCLGYVWMTLDHRNASEMRLGRILSITNIIEVPWTRISLTKVYFQGSGQMVLNTLIMPLRTSLARGRPRKLYRTAGLSA